MRKFKGSILCIAMTLSLCACGDSKTSNSKDVSSSNEPKSTIESTVEPTDDPVSEPEVSLEPTETLKEYYYITADKSVGLCDYHELKYSKFDTSVSDAEVEEKIQSTLEYFQSFMEIDELTDEIIAEYYEDYSSVDDLRKAYGVILKEKKEEEKQAHIRDEVLKQIVDKSDIFVDYTDDAKETLKSLMAHYNALAVANNMSLEDYVKENLGQDYETFKLQVADDATTLTLRRLILIAVAESEGIEINDKEYKERIKKYMEYYGYEKQELFEYEYSVEFIRENMLNDVALEYLISVAKEI